MKPAIRQRLADLNREFYARHGLDFAATRPRLAPGVQRILRRVPAGARVLEAGCGDGKVARALAAGAPAAVYLGLDQSREMLDRARGLTAQDPRLDAEARARIAFAQADLGQAGWAAGLGEAGFDWVLAFAVFHHLPGAQARREVLRTLAGRLQPGGWLAMSNWQFTRSARLRRRIEDWSKLGLSPADVEPGDHLLAWERGGQRGLRYVHLLEGAEAQAMALAAGLEVAEFFASDGEGGGLADYALMRKSSTLGNTGGPRRSPGTRGGAP